MEGGENHDPPRFCIEVNVRRGGQKLAFPLLHYSATQQNAVEDTVDLHCKTMCFNKLFGGVNIFLQVLSKKDTSVYAFFSHNTMPQMSQILRECAIGTLTTGMYTRPVVR
jgi:hypothetical protein